MSAPTTPFIVPAALVGGYLVGRATGHRPLAGVVLLAGLGYAVPRWTARRDGPTAAAVAAGTLALVGVSHPLARRLGPGGAVAVSAAAAGALAAVGEGRSR